MVVNIFKNSRTSFTKLPDCPTYSSTNSYIWSLYYFSMLSGIFTPHWRVICSNIFIYVSVCVFFVFLFFASSIHMCQFMCPTCSKYIACLASIFSYFHDTCLFLSKGAPHHDPIKIVMLLNKALLRYI